MKYGRAMLRDVAAYTPGEQPSDSRVIKLNTNENPYPPSPRVLEVIRSMPPESMQKYPDAVSLRFRQLCAERFGCPGADWIIAGNGMDELLAMALRTFVDPGDAVVTTQPTYTLYETLTRLHGARLETVPLNEDFLLPDDAKLPDGRLCFITRPNAPSGVCEPAARIETLCGQFPGIVVIDEAYADFADENCMALAGQFDNVVVMRTFSKSYSLAGLRVGVAVARPELMRQFFKTKDSYNLNAVSQAAAAAALEDAAHMEANTAKIRTTRERLTFELVALGFHVPPSQSNYVLAQCTGSRSARSLFESLRNSNIFVRYFDIPGLDNSLRISVGTDAQIDRLLEALR